MATKKPAAKKKVAAKKAVVAKKAAPKKKVAAKKVVTAKKVVAKKAVVAKKVVAKKIVAAKKVVAQKSAPAKAVIAKKEIVAKPVVTAPVKKKAAEKVAKTEKMAPPKLEENTFLNLKIAKVKHEDPRTLHEDQEEAPEVEHGPLKPIVRETPKVGRNEPCPCGSGLKYKKCHGKE